MKPVISVIIPTYHEQDSIASTLKNIAYMHESVPYEVIVVDASNDDLTYLASQAKGVKRIRAKDHQKGRANQMNLGASRAKSDVLFFIHADTLLPKSWDTYIENAYTYGVDAGGFRKQFDNDSVVLKINAWWCNLRMKYRNGLLGDHGLFIRKDVFDSVGGFSKVPIMEEIDLAKKLKKKQIALLPATLTTSARRFEQFGTLKTLILMAKLRILYYFGKDPIELKKLYSDKK